VQIAAVDIIGSVEQALNDIFGFLPNLIGFLLILLIGYVVARVLKAIVTKLLEKAGLDRRLHESDASQYVERVSPNASPSNAIASVVFILVFAFFVFSAIGQLGIPALTDFMNQVLAYLPNVIAAILIFVVAAIVAGAAGGGAAKLLGDTPTGKIVATAVPALVMVIAVFMILSQLGIAEEIVQIAFAATMGALALGLALAFGLGGRPVAERMLEEAYQKGQEKQDQVKQDAQLARERGQEQAQRARQEAEGGSGGDTSTVSEQPTRTHQPPPGGSYRAS
jgi:small-conductance mechanosensitive channel